MPSAPRSAELTPVGDVVTDPRRQRMILIAMCTALVAVIASVSGLNVAQQDLAVDLGASQSTLLWIINGYTMALAALLLPVGAIGDRYGRKRVLLAGLVVFTLANVAAALAPTATFLLVARVVAGAGAAMIMPVTLSVITSSFPAEDRAKAVGVWAGFAGAGGILGLFFSSAMIDYFTWPWVFAMPAVLSIVSFVITMLVVGNSREDHAGRFDIVGSVLSALAIGGLVLGIHEGPERGWTDALTLVALAGGALTLAGFIWWELRQSHPLFDVRLLRNRSLSSGALNLMVLFAVMFGLFLVLVQFLQAVLGYSALRASVSLLPLAAVMMPLSGFAPTVAKRIGTRTTLLVGTGLFAVGLALMAIMASVEGGYWSVFPGLLVLGVGMGLAMTPSTTAITETLPNEKQGVASALNDTVRELGGALGVALLGSVLNSAYRSNVATATEGLPAALQEPVEAGIGSALAVSAQLGDAGAVVADAARNAFVEGWQVSMWVGVGLAALVFVYLLVRGPRPEPTGASDTDTISLSDAEVEVAREPVLVSD
jgi:EmrB/QacA subfamily drug resistance transporter